MTDAQMTSWDDLEGRFPGTRFTLLNGPVEDDDQAAILEWENEDLSGQGAVAVQPDGRVTHVCDPDLPKEPI